MKKQELEDIKTAIKDLQEFCNQQDYNTTTFINKRINIILPKIQKELDRMDNTKIEINCPKLLLITSDEAYAAETTLTEYVNKQLQELVLNEYKIIDYGIWNSTESKLFIYIKYTS